jgi:Cytochrome c553
MPFPRQLLSPARSTGPEARPIRWRRLRLALPVALLSFGCWSAAAMAGGPPSDLGQRLAACDSCHGAKGQGGIDDHPYYPRLAGLPAPYILTQLERFQRGERHFAIMQDLVKDLPYRYLVAISNYFAGQQAEYPKPESNPADAKAIERGRELALHGDFARGVEACSACHGEDLGGVGAIPGIAGQHAAYLTWQLDQWKTGQRSDESSGVMSLVADRLSDEDVRDVSLWLAQARPGQHHSLQTPTDQPHLDKHGNEVPHLYPVRGPQTREVRRGRYLAMAGDCAGCHTRHESEPFAGAYPLNTPFGTLYSTNITPDRKDGIGNWTFDEFYQAFHDGIAPGHRYLYPAFPFTSYTHVTKRDARAIYTYLRTLKPIPQPNHKDELQWPYSIRWMMLGWRLLFFHPQPLAVTGHTEQWRRGAYLVKGLGHCEACHSPRNLLGATESSHQLAGGEAEGWRAPNISSNPRYGIGSWSQQDLVTFLKTGITPKKTAALGPMKEVIHDSLQFLRLDDLQAIAYYLKHVESQGGSASALPPRVGSRAPVPAAEGKTLYEANCAECHGVEGRGYKDVYPALAADPMVTDEDPTDAIRTVIMGGFAPATESRPYPYSMTPFGPRLSDRQIAAVLSYVRHAWNNNASGVSVSEVAAQR